MGMDIAGTAGRRPNVSQTRTPLTGQGAAISSDDEAV